MSAGVRQITSADAPAIQAFVRGLSWRTRVERFFAPMMELSPWQLERVMSARGLNLGAFDASGRMVAHAQYVRDDAGAAEFGIVVSDALQGQGLGARLLAELVEHARNAGIRDFAGVALTDNASMRRLARKLGFAFKRDEDPQLVRMERWLGDARELAA